MPGDSIKSAPEAMAASAPASNLTIKEFLVGPVDRLSKAAPGDVQEIAASQIQLLSSFYELALGQARRSFRWALIAAGIGLIFFLSAVVFLLIYQMQNISTVSLISGALIEVISAINFYLYGKTSNQLAEFHNRLDLTQRFLLANSLCESIEGNYKHAARFALIKTIAKIDKDIDEVGVKTEGNTSIQENRGD